MKIFTLFFLQTSWLCAVTITELEQGARVSFPAPIRTDLSVVEAIRELLPQDALYLSKKRLEENFSSGSDNIQLISIRMIRRVDTGWYYRVEYEHNRAKHLVIVTLDKKIFISGHNPR